MLLCLQSILPSMYQIPHVLSIAAHCLEQCWSQSRGCMKVDSTESFGVIQVQALAGDFEWAVLAAVDSFVCLAPMVTPVRIPGMLLQLGGFLTPATPSSPELNCFLPFQEPVFVQALVTNIVNGLIGGLMFVFMLLCGFWIKKKSFKNLFYFLHITHIPRP